MADIDFSKATVSGVAEAKAEAAAMAMKSKVAKQIEKRDMKDMMDPNSDKKSKEEKAAAKAEKALKNAYIQDAASKIRSGTTTTDDSRLPVDEKEQMRLHLCAKLARYYSLPQFKSRPRIQITDKLSIESLKAEIYDIEQSALNPAELFFGLTVMFGQVIEKASVRPEDHSLRFGMDLRGFHSHIVANKSMLDPHLQVLAVKYSTLMPTGPWAGLACALIQVAHHTHTINSSQSSHVSRPEAPTDLHDPYSPLSPDTSNSIDAEMENMRTRFDQHL